MDPSGDPVLSSLVGPAHLQEVPGPGSVTRREGVFRDERKSTSSCDRARKGGKEILGRPSFTTARSVKVKESLLVPVCQEIDSRTPKSQDLIVVTPPMAPKEER